MKLYCQFPVHKTALEKHFGDKITCVDTPKEAAYLLSGRFTEADYHPDLKGVIIPYTGHDQIDLETMRKHNLKLFNVTGHSRFVAERALQLLHAVTGKVVNYHNRLAQGDWSGRTSPNERIPWDSLFERQIGLFGYGRIGQWVEKLLRPFNPEIYVIDRGKHYDGVTTVPNLSTLAEQSDIIIISAPLTAETEGVFDQAIFEQLGAAFLVNVGRGKIIDEHALYEALASKRLLGFASDVWFKYPKDARPTYPSSTPLHTFDNVVMTPHSGGHTTTSFDVMFKEIVSHVEALLKGNTHTALDLEKLS